MGFQKNEYFLGMKILWIFLGGHQKIRLYFLVISMHFLGILQGQGTERGYFGGLLKFQIFLGVLEIPVFFCLFCCFFVVVFFCFFFLFVFFVCFFFFGGGGGGER